MTLKPDKIWRWSEKSEILLISPFSGMFHFILEFILWMWKYQYLWITEIFQNFSTLWQRIHCYLILGKLKCIFKQLTKIIASPKMLKMSGWGSYLSQIQCLDNICSQQSNKNENIKYYKTSMNNNDNKIKYIYTNYKFLVILPINYRTSKVIYQKYNNKKETKNYWQHINKYLTMWNYLQVLQGWSWNPITRSWPIRFGAHIVHSKKASLCTYDINSALIFTYLYFGKEHRF